MIKKFSILALAVATALPLAFASPTVSLSMSETGFSPITATSGTGFVAMTNVSYGDFQINNVTGTGSPIYSAPDLDLQTLNVSSNTLTASKTLTIELTETGITGVPNPAVFFNAFTGLLKGVTSENLWTYTDPNNVAFATTDLVATTSFTAQGANAVNQTASSPTGNPFSETEIIVAVFGPTSNNVADSLNSSIFMATSVPEPASLALFGGGLLGLALVRRRSKSK